MRSNRGRNGKRNHHFEAFLHRENELEKKREFRNICIGTATGAAWTVLTVVSYLIH